MTRALLAVLTLALMPVSAAAQSRPSTGEVGVGLDAPPEGSSTRRRRRPRPAPTHTEPAEPWSGPRVELGYAHYSISDGFGGGDVNSVTFGGYLPTGPLRFGAYAEYGGRAYELAQNHGLIRATLLAGYQHFGWLPLVPYAAVVGTLGFVFGKRFSTPFALPMGGAGLEVGADLNLTGTLFLGMSLSYIRASFDSGGYDLFSVRVRIGL
ncbi:MAG: hypothetical protein AAGF12_23440 [Myxococcota bacterium]